MDSHPGTAKINFLGDNPTKGQIINAKGENNSKARVIDGFVKVASTSTNLHQRGQRAQTLMRGSLKKPKPVNRIQDQRPGTDRQREVRARQTTTHSKIDRFGGIVSSLKTNDKAGKEPLLHGEVINRAAPKRAKSAETPPVLPSMVASASHSRLERMLDEALTKADAHKQALRYQAARHFWQRPGFFSRKRWLKLSVLAVVVLGASLFIAWQKVPQLSLKLASMRAHVDASAPSYKPAGYSVSGPAKALDHAVAIKYASAEGNYTVEEQPSNQDSTSLIADNTSSSQQIQTARANGIPIVILKNKVKCVSNGIETTITNQANLSADELLNIAKSICA